MKIELQARGIRLTRSLSTFARLRLRSALATNSRHITRVQVTLSDINGPRGGVDKLCQCHVSMAGGQDIVIRQTSESMYAAISSAAARAGRNVVKALGKSGKQKLSSKMRRTLTLRKQLLTT